MKTLVFCFLLVFTDSVFAKPGDELNDPLILKRISAELLDSRNSALEVIDTRPGQNSKKIELGKVLAKVNVSAMQCSDQGASGNVSWFSCTLEVQGSTPKAFLNFMVDYLGPTGSSPDGFGVSLEDDSFSIGLGG